MVLLYIKAAFIFISLFTFVVITKPEVIKFLLMLILSKLNILTNSIKELKK